MDHLVMTQLAVDSAGTGTGEQMALSLFQEQPALLGADSCLLLPPKNHHRCLHHFSFHQCY